MVLEISVFEVRYYHWIGFFIAAILGGIASSFVNNSGMVKMWGWEMDGDTKKFNMGIIADIIIGLTAAFGILGTIIPQTIFQFLSMGAIGGYGGSSILRSLVNKVAVDGATKENNLIKNELEATKTNIGINEAYLESNEKRIEENEAIKDYLAKTNKNILAELYRENIIR